MAKLTYGARKAMPQKDFALPAKRKGGKGGYPIEDAAHARNALARVAQHGTAAQKSEVRAKVHRKFPSIGEKHVKESKDESFKTRGHFEHQRKAADAGELSHEEFEGLTHGKHDHMPGRKLHDFEHIKHGK